MLRNNGIDSDRRRFGFRAFIRFMDGGDTGVNAHKIRTRRKRGKKKKRKEKNESIGTNE